MVFYSDFEKKGGSDSLLAIGRIATVKQDNQFAVALLKMNLIGLSDYAIKKEFLCMSATRYKFISVGQGRHVRSTIYIVLFPQTQITLLRYILIRSRLFNNDIYIYRYISKTLPSFTRT